MAFLHLDREGLTISDSRCLSRDERGSTDHSGHSRQSDERLRDLHPDFALMVQRRGSVDDE